VETAPAGVNEPRNPRASSLHALVEDYYEEFERVYDDRCHRGGHGSLPSTVQLDLFVAQNRGGIGTGGLERWWQPRSQSNEQQEGRADQIADGVRDTNLEEPVREPTCQPPSREAANR